MSSSDLFDRTLNQATNEASLLLSSMAAMTPAVAGRIAQLLTYELDWQWILKTARSHRIELLLHRALKSCSVPALPADVREKLDRAAYSNAARNTFLVNELFSIIEMLDASGVRYFPFKGPLLSVTAYGDISIRQFDDLDFMIDRRDVEAASDRLIASGFKPTLKMTPGQRNMHLDDGWGFSLHSPAGDYIVELDTAIAPAYFSMKCDPAIFWHGLHAVEMERHRLNTLSDTNLLLFLFAHAAKHTWDRLAWAADVAGIVARNKDLNWSELLARSTALGCRRMVLVGLGITGATTGASLPGEIRQLIKDDSRAEEIVTASVKNLISKDQRARSPLCIATYHMALKDGFMTKLQYAFRWFFRPTFSDWQAIHLPASLAWLYYIVRPIRIACRVIPGSTAPEAHDPMHL